jgi:hypothetical protein
VLAAIKERYDAAKKLLEDEQAQQVAALEAQVKAYQAMAKDSITEVDKLRAAWDALTAAILKAQQAATGVNPNGGVGNSPMGRSRRPDRAACRRASASRR